MNKKSKKVSLKLEIVKLFIINISYKYKGTVREFKLLNATFSKYIYSTFVEKRDKSSVSLKLMLDWHYNLMRMES